MRKRINSIISVLFLAVTMHAQVSLSGLRTEQLDKPLNVENPQPRLSWIIQSSEKGVMQTAYHVLVASSPEKLAANEGDLWDSGKTDCDQSIWVPYNGKQLKSNQRCYWKVKVYTTKGESTWSEPSEWGMGPLGEIHWGGRWIGWDGAFEWDREDSHSRLSSRYLRTEFNTQDKEIKRATVHICGLGMYELFMNGQRIGDQVLAPAPSDYRRTVIYNSFDVTEQLTGNNTANAIGVTLGNGRFYTMRQNYKPYKIPTFGYPKMRLNLFIEYTDGTTQRVNSDPGSWKLTAQGPIRSNNEYDGEVYDARMELGEWTKAGYDDSKWLTPQRVSLPYGTLRPNIAPNMKVMQTLKPKTFNRYDGERYMVDFGQNMAGWVRINIRKAAAGDTIRIRYAERIMNEGKELDVENLRHSWSTDYYICNGKEKNTSWASRFSYHGFQYIEVTGYKGLKAEDLVAEVVYDDLANNGSFECSNDVLNQLCRNAWWGISSNYKGVPLDCPQRDERQPWLGDHAVGTWGENFLFDNGTMYAKWADDIREAQREDGCIPDICPAYYNYFTSEMTWSSTFPVICEMVYEQNGNIEPIRKNYAAIKKWLHHIRSEFTTNEGVIRADKYGDWCMPPEGPTLIHSKDPARQTDGTLIASAYYYKMSMMTAEFARRMGLNEEAKALEADAEEVKRHFNKKFLTVKKGTSPAKAPHYLYPDSIFYGNNTVTSNILPLAFNMVPDEYKEEVQKNVINTILTTNKGHISCGVIGMNWLMRELTRMGRGDVAFLLATNKTYPSYGYMFEKGATAIWELWNGDTASRKMNSCNHVMILGDVITWLFRDLAGFNPAKPAYKEIILKPDFSIDNLSYANGSYNTLYGKLTSSWKKENQVMLKWDITIPCNTTAQVYLPTTDEKAIKDKNITFLRREGDNTVWNVPSGSYHLEVPINPSLGVDREGILVDQFLYEKAGFPQCHGATILEQKNGDLIAAFFGGKHERNPDCCIWVCRKPKGATAWSEPYLAADGVFSLNDPNAAIAGITAESTPASAGPIASTFKGDVNKAYRKACWNPVLFQVPGSKEIILFYKIGLKVADWTGWLVRSKDGGKTWSQREALPEGFLGPIKNKPEYIDGRIICPSSTEGDGWRVHFEISDDKGKTWRKVGPIEAELNVPTQLRKANTKAEDDMEGGEAIKGEGAKPIYAIQPSILRHKDGRLQVVCRTRNAKIASSFSNDNGETWSKVTLLDIENNNSGTDAVTLKDGRHVLVYNNFETLPGTPKGVRTPLSIAVSDDGIHWTHKLTLEESPINQYSYPSIIQGKDGKLHVVYTWRRQRVKYMEIDLKK